MALWDRVGSPGESSRPAGGKPAERRAKERKRQRLVDGFILLKRMPKPQPCTVCDMSVGGSKVEIWNDAARLLQPGDRVTLYIPVDRSEVDAEVRWRRENAVGLRFQSPFRPPTRQYG